MGRGWKRARTLSTAPVPYPTAVFPAAEAEPACQDLRGHFGQRSEDPNLDSIDRVAAGEVSAVTQQVLLAPVTPDGANSAANLRLPLFDYRCLWRFLDHPLEPPPPHLAPLSPGRIWKAARRIRPPTSFGLARFRRHLQCSHRWSRTLLANLDSTGLVHRPAEVYISGFQAAAHQRVDLRCGPVLAERPARVGEEETAAERLHVRTVPSPRPRSGVRPPQTTRCRTACLTDRGSATRKPGDS